MNKPDLHIVSLSGGKDSTAMLLRMLEEKMPVDIILFCDTGLEFDAMYKHIDKLGKYINQPITRLKAPYPLSITFMNTHHHEEILPLKEEMDLVGRGLVIGGVHRFSRQE